MKHLIFIAAAAASAIAGYAGAQDLRWQPDVTRQQTYVLHRASSSDPTGANADSRRVESGATFTVLDADGPGSISHIWFTISDNEAFHLKRIVLRIYWDGETTPSVEAPIGDFFGLGLGTYHNWQSEMLSVGSIKALNSYFRCPIGITLASRSRMKAKSQLIAFITTSTIGRSYIHFPRALSISTHNTGRPSPITDGPMIGRIILCHLLITRQ